MVIVGDVKYKRIQAEGILHPDLYQLLAYCVATQLQAGLLIVAAGEGEQPVTHKVRHIGRDLQVTTLDLQGSPDSILAQIRELADHVRAMERAAVAPALLVS